MKTLQERGNDDDDDQEHLNTMKGSLKHLLENIQSFDTRFRKLQLLLIASRGRSLLVWEENCIPIFRATTMLSS